MNQAESSSRLLAVTFVGMELSWRYACLNLLSILLLPGSFPWLHTVGAFVVAALLTALFRGRGLRVIGVLLPHLVLFALLGGSLVHHFQGNGLEFFSRAWLVGLAGSPQPWQTWLSVIFELSLAAWLWIGGFNLARRPKDYERVGIRFDIGLTSFFVVLLVEALLGGERFAVQINDRVTSPMMLAFFCFGLLSLALARSEGQVPRDIRPGYRGLGLVFTFLLIVLAFSGGAMAFFMPYLTAAAESGLQAAKTVLKPLAPYVLAVLRFVLVGQRQDSSPGGQGKDASPGGALGGGLGESASWLVVAGQVAGWTMLVLLCLTALVLAVYFLYRLWLRLMDRTEGGAPRLKLLDQLLDWLPRWLKGVSAWFARNLAPRTRPLEIYLGLLQWGRRSGLPRRPGETPREYGERLARALPKAAGEIGAIVRCLELAVFAARPLAGPDQKALRKSWRRLARPGLWAQRLKAWLPGAARQA